MKLHKWEDIKARRMTPAQRERVEREVERELLDMDLRTLREALGKTQVEVAAAAEMTQGELSRAERREDHRVSMIRRIVRAMGGEIEIVAHVGDKTVRIDL